MERIKLLILSTFLVLIHSFLMSSVTVTTNKPRVEVHEAEDAVLSCEFKTEKETEPRIEWKKKKGSDVSFVFYKGKFEEPYVGRAEIKGATVTLHKVTQRDAGEYRCEVSAQVDKVTLGEINVTLKVLVPPNTPICEIPSSALTGSQVQLHCRDKQSIPPATYKWYKDSKLLISVQNQNITLNPKTGTLQFNIVSRADTGLYHCEASNGVGTPQRCKGKHMKIDDLNMAAIIAAAVVAFLLVCLCVLGVYCARRQGCFHKGHRGRSFWIPRCHDVTHISSQSLHREDDITNTNYSKPPEDQQDFKHTRSFML